MGLYSVHLYQQGYTTDHSAISSKLVFNLHRTLPNKDFATAWVGFKYMELIKMTHQMNVSQYFNHHPTPVRDSYIVLVNPNPEPPSLPTSPLDHKIFVRQFYDHFHVSLFSIEGNPKVLEVLNI